MRTELLATALLVALSTSTAHADDHLWEGIFVGSVGVALGGSALLWHGTVTVNHAEENLCTGNYADSCDHAQVTNPQLLAHYNDNGERGETIAQIGSVMVIAGSVLGVVALYKAFIAKDEPATETQRMTFAPTISREGAGASLSLRW
jgi:hypothetical protein